MDKTYRYQTTTKHSNVNIMVRIYDMYDTCIHTPIALINSLAPRRPRCHFKTAIINLVLLIGIFTSSKDNALKWMPRDLTDDKSTLVQGMAWCRQATSHYLSQCWPSSMSPYGVTRPQWVNSDVVGQKYVITFSMVTTLLMVTVYLINIHKIYHPTVQKSLNF